MGHSAGKAPLMVKIDSTAFGKVVVNGNKYEDILIIGNSVIPRDKEKIRAIYGTSHMLSKEEAVKLLKDNPEIVVIGNGQHGALKVDEEAAGVIKKSAELIVARTPEAIKKYNECSRMKRTNALIHVTC